MNDSAARGFLIDYELTISLLILINYENLYDLSDN